MQAFLVVMAAASAVVVVVGMPSSHKKHEGGMAGDSMKDTWGMVMGENCTMESWGMDDGTMEEGMGHMEGGSMKGKGNCSMPSLPMVFQKIHVMHLCKGKPEEGNCTARAKHCMNWLDLGMDNGQDFHPRADVCEEGDANCTKMYQKCLALLTPAEGTPEVSPVSVICSVQDHADCLTRMPDCVAKLYPGRAAPVMPPKGSVVCEGHEDMEHCQQMVSECREMMMGFVRMLSTMGPEEMMSMLPDGMGMEHDMAYPEPEPEAEPMGEGMPVPPACRDFMMECMTMMRPGPAGHPSEAEACHGMKGDACSKKYTDCHAFMTDAKNTPPPDMPDSAEELCDHMAEGTKESCVPAATMCHEKLKPPKTLIQTSMNRCLTRSSPCPKFPSSPEEHHSLMTCMEPVLRGHISGALMIPLEAPGEHGATASAASSHTTHAAHDTAAYNACFHDNHMVMDVMKCAMKQCIKEEMKGV